MTGNHENVADDHPSHIQQYDFFICNYLALDDELTLKLFTPLILC